MPRMCHAFTRGPARAGGPHPGPARVGLLAPGGPAGPQGSGESVAYGGAREETPSLRKMLVRWRPTVSSATIRAAAMAVGLAGGQMAQHLRLAGGEAPGRPVRPSGAGGRRPRGPACAAPAVGARWVWTAPAGPCRARPRRPAPQGSAPAPRPGPGRTGPAEPGPGGGDGGRATRARPAAGGSRWVSGQRRAAPAGGPPGGSCAWPAARGQDSRQEAPPAGRRSCGRAHLRRQGRRRGRGPRARRHPPQRLQVERHAHAVREPPAARAPGPPPAGPWPPGRESASLEVRGAARGRPGRRRGRRTRTPPWPVGAEAPRRRPAPGPAPASVRRRSAAPHPPEPPQRPGQAQGRPRRLVADGPAQGRL